MATESTCNRCGASLTDATVGPLCPACLAALGSASWLEASTKDSTGPSVEDPSAVVASVQATRKENPSEPATGSVGPYELLEVIGQGGMGVIWRVRDRDLSRNLAMKIMTGGLGLPAVVLSLSKDEGGFMESGTTEEILTVAWTFCTFPASG